MSNAAFNVKTAQCPGCGAELSFKVGSSRVIVCDYCRFAVARTDRGLENIGKVADLVPTGARLTLGLEGRHEGVDFAIVGRVQLAWEQGAWDEWYVSFNDGRWGWLAEAQGRYYLSFRVSPRPVPPWTALQPGRQIFLSGYGRLVVADLKKARYVAARGELPESFTIGEVVASADLSGAGGLFATLDYGEDEARPLIFVGRELQFEQLALRQAGMAMPRPQRITAAKITCPKCNGPLELQVPDQTQRVTCPHCSALIDTTEGTPRYLATVKRRRLLWELGSRCTFFGVEYLNIGWLERACEVDGIDYFWEEYLLYDEATAGFRFLVNSDGHWSFVSPLGAGDIEEGTTGVRFESRLFKPFSAVTARVTSVLGEFYWAVQQGERVEAEDYVRPPEGISVERSASEVNWSHAVYLQPAEVWEGFGSVDRPLEPRGVGSMQPCPFEQDVDRSIKWALWAAAAAVLLFLLMIMRADEQVVFHGQFPQGPIADFLQRGAPGPGGANFNDRFESHAPTASQPWTSTTSFSEPFLIEKSNRNIEVRLTSNVNQSWAFISGALINETTNEFSEFTLESSYYSGTDSDGYWSEDKREATTYLSRVPPGRYTLRVEAGWEPRKSAPSLTLRLTSGVPRILHFMLAMVPIILIPMLLVIRRSNFESKRWEESNVGGDDD